MYLIAGVSLILGLGTLVYADPPRYDSEIGGWLPRATWDLITSYGTPEWTPAPAMVPPAPAREHELAAS